jgi:hypothetical protein
MIIISIIYLDALMPNIEDSVVDASILDFNEICLYFDSPKQYVKRSAPIASDYMVRLKSFLSVFEIKVC